MYADDLKKSTEMQIPEDFLDQLSNSDITLTTFTEKNAILKDTQLRCEVGFGQFPDGSYLVSMTCPMPGITSEMIAWWFWWHPQADERYQRWFPGEHYSVSYDKRNKDYFLQSTLPAFQPNTQYPVERIGSMKMPLRIDFVLPEEFGFSRQTMEENNVPIIVCGHVSALRGLIPHTEMAHIFFRTEDGLLLTSRFWIGKTLKNKILRKVILTENTARGMAEHCYLEYRNLAKMLPDLYRQNFKNT